MQAGIGGQLAERHAPHPNLRLDFFTVKDLRAPILVSVGRIGRHFARLPSITFVMIWLHSIWRVKSLVGATL